MKKRVSFCCILLVLGLAVQAQAPNFEEIRDTLRFVRLAESKKQLSFDEDKLLKVNEILDDIEERKFELVAREQRVRRRARNQDLSDEQATRFLEEMVSIKKETMENELSLVTRIQEVLTPRECIELLTFYNKFTREVQKKIRMLQQRNQGPGKRRFQGRRN